MKAFIFHAFLHWMKITGREEEVDKIDYEARIAELMDQYQNLILSICYKLTQDYFAAQDLTQETFLSAYKHLESFDGENEKAWLCRIASNKCIDYQRQAQRRQIPTQDDDMERYLSVIGRPEHEALEKQVRIELQENCRKLRPPYDEIAYQYFYLELKPEEIARRQKKNPKTIQTQIYRARDMMRRIYHGAEEKKQRNSAQATLMDGLKRNVIRGRKRTDGKERENE